MAAIIIIFLAHLIVFFGLGRYLGLMNIEEISDKEPIKKEDTLSIILVGIMLVFINPIIEEWFWRIFLYECFPKTEAYKWLVSLFYGSYHFIPFW